MNQESRIKGIRGYLSKEDIEEIRSKDLSQRSYAKLYGLSRSVIERIQGTRKKPTP
jgi:DNA-binding transcriptional regulator YiaG